MPLGAYGQEGMSKMVVIGVIQSGYLTQNRSIVIYSDATVRPSHIVS